MAASEVQGSYLVVMHDDVLLPGQVDHADAIPGGDAALSPTRTVSASRYVLGSESCSIGRDPSCAIRIRSHRIDISRNHAEIRLEGDHYVLHCSGRNGTYVNSKQVDGPHYLVTDDILGFANSREMLRYASHGAEEERASPLTDRELEVLRLVALGKLNKEIADKLQVTLYTVATHLKNIYEKLGVHNRTQAVGEARKLRLL